MSDTPRTNAAAYQVSEKAEGLIMTPVKFARQLERELNAAKAEIESLETSLTDIAEYWNEDENESAMSDACWHAVGTAKKALTNINKHN